MQKAFKDIVERLEEEIEDVIVKDTYSKGKNAGLRKAKMIVNQVAEEYKSTEHINCSTDSSSDEVCEWRERLENHELMYKHCTYTNDTVTGVGYFKYCPYCGKKLKVI